MEVVFDKDSSFFFIESDDLGKTKIEKDVTNLISDDVTSLTITEELGKITNGILSLKDNQHIYSRIFRNGLRFDLTWGYKKWNKDFRALNVFKQNPAELVGGGSRKGLECVIQTRGGVGDNNGATTYDVAFYGDEILTNKVYKIYRSGTYSAVVSQGMEQMGITEKLIDFGFGKNTITSDTQIMQRKRPFAFLLRLAAEWRAVFKIGFKPNGKKVGLFIDPSKIGGSQYKKFIADVTGILGSERSLYYNYGDFSNVKSYNWKHHFGESGQGDGTIITIVNGKPVFQRFIAETEKVITYRLNEKRIREKFAKSPDKVAFFRKHVLDPKDFKEVEWAFDAVESESAPQGIGYSVNASLVGDPMITVPLRMVFKDYFPGCLKQDRIAGSLIKFFLRKATHRLTKTAGYTTNIEVADTYTITGSFIEFAQQTA